MIKNATFTSVWDGGYEITTGCKVNTETKQVFDIEKAATAEHLVEVFDYEYVTVDGNDHPVFNVHLNDTEYWYN